MTAAATHKCSRCKEHKIAAEFSSGPRKRKRSREVDAYCRACRRSYARGRVRVRTLHLPLDASTIHTCRTCQQARPASDFAPSNVAKRSWGKCRACRRGKYQQNIASEHARAHKRSMDRRHGEKAYTRELKRRYGMTRAEYDARLSAQAGQCACCGATSNGLKSSRSASRFHVDHDHATGELRGLLCHKCNIGIGALGDTAAGVRRALVYLEQPDTAGIGAGLLY